MNHLDNLSDCLGLSRGFTREATSYALPNNERLTLYKLTVVKGLNTMQQTLRFTSYKGFYILKRLDHNTNTVLYVGTMQGLRLTAPSLTEMKKKIDERDMLRAEIAQLEFRNKPRIGVAFNDYSIMYMDEHETNRMVSHVVSHGVSQGAY
ncbi:MAG: hypothetical protein B7X95_05270 [Methylophilaceae bacterium 17-44-8]|nr:MAG: hypothetical protein B7X95_05270 [Methylophilaceae bacterium 17-44-8]